MGAQGRRGDFFFAEDESSLISSTYFMYSGIVVPNDSALFDIRQIFIIRTSLIESVLDMVKIRKVHCISQY